MAPAPRTMSRFNTGFCRVARTKASTFESPPRASTIVPYYTSPKKAKSSPPGSKSPNGGCIALSSSFGKHVKQRSTEVRPVLEEPFQSANPVAKTIKNKRNNGIVMLQDQVLEKDVRIQELSTKISSLERDNQLMGEAKERLHNELCAHLKKDLNKVFCPRSDARATAAALNVALGFKRDLKRR